MNLWKQQHCTNSASANVMFYHLANKTEIKNAKLQHSPIITTYYNSKHHNIAKEALHINKCMYCRYKRIYMYLWHGKTCLIASPWYCPYWWTSTLHYHRWASMPKDSPVLTPWWVTNGTDYILLSDSDVCLALCCIVASRGHATKPCQIQKKLSPSLFNLRFCRVLQLQVTPAVFLYNRRPATCAIYKDHARRIQFGRCRLKEANEEFKETRWSGGKLIPKFWHSWYTIETYRIIPFSLTWELRYWQTAPKNLFGTKRHNKFIQIFWSLAPHWM